MTQKKIQLTKEGLGNLERELKDLREVARPVAVEKLEKARGMGDLSENSAYTTAREEMTILEGRIQELDDVIRNAEIIENSTTDEIGVGNRVTVEINNNLEDLHVVGEFEADPMNKKLSNISPIGRALIGKKVGDVIEIEIPSGRIKYKIIAIK